MNFYYGWITAMFLLFGTLLAQTGPGGIGNSSNNKLWLRSDAGITLNGSNVSSWADQSGNGNHVTQSTAANQPTFVSNEVNGQPVVRFDGTNDWMTNAGFSLDLEANGHMYVIFKTSTSQNNTYMMSFPEALLGGNGFDMGLTTTSVMSNVRTTALFTSLASATETYTDNTARLVHTFFNAGLSLGEHQLYINGTFRDQQNNSGPLITNVVQELYVGCFSAAFGAFYTGDIVEVIIYNTALSAAERTILDNYLAIRYNISISNSRYASSTFTLDVAGIGREGGTSYTEAGSAGLVLIDNGAMNSDGDYLMAGHNLVNNSIVTSDLPVGVAQRWQRVWYLDKTGALDGGNVQIAFDFSEGGFGGTTPGNAANYRLLRRPGTSGDFEEVTVTNTAVSGDRVIFDVDDSETTDDNYYTVGATSSDEPLPVNLASFSARLSDGNVQINWVTQSEINNERFMLERSEDDQNYEIIDIIPGQGNSSSEVEYSVTDTRVFPGRTYFYRLADQDVNGNITYHPSISINVPNEIPTEVDATVLRGFKLFANYPNPFNPGTNIQYELLEEGPVSLAIYNQIGQKVKTLVSEMQPSGSYIVSWDGRNELGEALPSGFYFYQLSLGKKSEARRMLLLK